MMDKHLLNVQRCKFVEIKVLSDPSKLFLLLTDSGITDRRNDCIIPRKIWRK